MRRRSTTGKLTLLALASFGVAVTLVSGVLAWRDGDRDTRAALDRFSSIAKVTAAMSEEAAAAGDRQRAFAALRAIRAIPEITYARIERPDGGLIAETGAAVRLTRDVAADTGRQTSIATVIGSHTAEVRAPITYAGHMVGRVVMLGRLDDGLARLMSGLLLSLVAGVAVALVGRAVAVRLQRRIAGPVVALTESMARRAREPRLRSHRADQGRRRGRRPGGRLQRHAGRDPQPRRGDRRAHGRSRARPSPSAPPT